MYNFFKIGKYIVDKQKTEVDNMSVEKHLLVTGTSTISWKDAIVQTITEASKTIDYLSGVKILEQRAKINGKKITEYLVDLDITFVIDRDRE